jgi:hypothetical protein
MTQPSSATIAALDLEPKTDPADAEGLKIILEKAVSDPSSVTDDDLRRYGPWLLPTLYTTRQIAAVGVFGSGPLAPLAVQPLAQFDSYIRSIELRMRSLGLPIPGDKAPEQKKPEKQAEADALPAREDAAGRVQTPTHEATLQTEASPERGAGTDTGPVRLVLLGPAGFPGGNEGAARVQDEFIASQTGVSGGAALAQKLDRPSQVAGRAGGGLRRAQSLARQFKASLPADEALPDRASAGRPVPDRDQDRRPDPANPQTPRDLAAAVRAYPHVFSRRGLRPALDASRRIVFLRADGTSASPEQVEALRAEIVLQPTAAVRDFNYLAPERGGIAPDHFVDLKDYYDEQPALRDTDFRHISLTDDRRDFLRSAACRLVEGSCNPHAAASYRAGEDVPPRDLRRIHARAQDEFGAPRGRRQRAPTEPAPPLPAHPDGGGHPWLVLAAAFAVGLIALLWLAWNRRSGEPPAR